MTPLRHFTSLIVEHYANLMLDSIIEESDTLSICTFFDKVKASMLTKWEAEIVKKSSMF